MPEQCNAHFGDSWGWSMHSCEHDQDFSAQFYFIQRKSISKVIGLELWQQAMKHSETAKLAGLAML